MWSYHLHQGFLSSLLSRLSSSLVSRLVFLSPCVVVVCCCVLLLCLVFCVLCCGVTQAVFQRVTPQHTRHKTQDTTHETRDTRHKTQDTRHKTTQHNTTQHNTPQHTTTHHNTPQHTTTHHNTKHNTAHQICPRRVITCFRGSPKVSTGSYTFSA